jgi:hypothetical protein
MKTITISRGYTVVVDDVDFEWLNQWRWTVRAARQTFYARRKQREDGRQIDVRMHRLIMGVTDPAIQVDHEDGNGLNNQRSNLRIATHGQNQQNRGVQSNNQLGVKGVYVVRKTGRYAARIGVDGRYIGLGSYLTVEEAARAYEEAALQYHGEFAHV